MKSGKVLFIGLHYQKKDEEKLYKYCKNGVSVAHFLFEENIILALSQNFDVEVISSLPIGSFPTMSNKLFFFTKRTENYQELGFLNLPILKSIIRKHKATKAIEEWIVSNKQETKYIVAYDAYLPFISAINRAVANDNDIVKLAIIPDLPGKLGIECEKYGGIIKRAIDYDAVRFFEQIKWFNGTVVLTEPMAEAIGYNDKPYMVMECIVDDFELEPYKPASHCDKKVLLYAGEISKAVDIEILFVAFSMFKYENVELWICGAGEAAPLVVQAANDDSRIKYFGAVPKAELNKMQKCVDVFLNPRQNSHAYTAYSFPSKNAEYLKTGRPVIAYKLSGIPCEYDDYIFYPKDNSPEALCSKIEEVLNMSEEEKRVNYYKQIDFMKGKNHINQGKRMFEFMKGINYEKK